MLEWVAISFSNAWKWKLKVKSLSCVWLLATPWTIAYQGPPSMGFSRQEYWSVLPLASPEKLNPAQIKDRDHTFLILKVKETFPTIQFLESQKGRGYHQSRWCQPACRLLHWNSILAKRRTCTPGGILRYSKYRLRTNQSKMTGQRKPGRNAPYKWFQLSIPWGHTYIPLTLISLPLPTPCHPSGLSQSTGLSCAGSLLLCAGFLWLQQVGAAL